jgi:hypothetical protein
MGSAFGYGLRAVAVASLLPLAGCVETVNEGVTDYRKATISDQSKQGSPTAISKKCALSDTTPFAGSSQIMITPGQETPCTTTVSEANSRLASRSPYTDADVNYQSHKEQFDASGRNAGYQDKTGDYREQSYVTLQINALDDTGPIAPPRVRSVTQEKAIRTKPNARRTEP